MLDERLVQLRPILCLDVLADRAAILDEQNGVLLLIGALGVRTREDVEEVSQEIWRAMEVVNNVDLIEEDQAVEYSESGIVKNARQNNILEIEQPVRPVDLVADMLVLYRNDLLELRRVGKILPVVRAVGGKVGIICDIRLASTKLWYDASL